jgi:YVTN family beta-propeller protein
VSATGGFGIVALAVDPVTDRIFVSNASDDSVVVINGRTNTVTASVALNGQVPAGLGVNFVTGKVYAALNNNQVAILNESTNAVTYATYGSQTSAVAVDPVLNREYVTDAVFDTPTVGVLGSKGQTLASVPVGLFPQGIDVDFASSLVFVANEADGTITEFTAQGGSVITTIPIAANSIVVNPVQSTVYAVGPTSVTVFAE